MGGEAAGRRPEAGARPERPAGGRQHAGEVSSVQPVEPGGLEEGGPGAIGLDRRPIASSRSSTAFQSERTPSGSGGISRSAGQRDIASPSRMPRTTPNASAAADTSPTTCSRPASGASATGSESSARRSPSAASSSKRG